jgi:hypothetical protein
LGGRLRKELGIANPHEVTDQIMRVWLDSVRITYPGPIFNGKKIQSLILIDAIIADFSDVKSIGSYISENSRGKQTPVDWLEWLVTRGKKVIIHTHAPVSAPYGQWSRTGNTIMKESVNEQYSVTPPHDGVPGNNFVTRALKQNMSQLESALNEAFYKVVK